MKKKLALAICIALASPVTYADLFLDELNLNLETAEQTEPLTEGSEESEGLPKLDQKQMLILAGFGALALSGGGGGGCTAPCLGDYRNTIDGSYLTEYNYQSMLSSINPLSLNDYGYDGTGIKVAVVDSGIDSSHPEFDGKTIYGYDFASSSTGYDNDENGHGTHVASIIAGERDGSGMRGVAYDATLYSYKTDNDGDSGLEALSSDTQIAAVFNRHVTDGINVSNNSWGGSTAVNSLTTTYVTTVLAQTITAAKAAQANGTLIVFAAGNNGRIQPDYIGALPYHDSDLKDSWITVVAVDSNLKETAYTNRCGVAYDFCVTAPGGGDTQSTDGILAAKAGTSTYVRYSGTSMATPHVSGLAAALMEKFPTLTPAQIATRIKSTASLASLTGYNGETLSANGTSTMQAIFGYGLVNSTAASSTIGTLTFPTSATLSGGITVGTKSMSLPSGVNGKALSNILNDSFIVFDSFDGATFEVTGKQLFNASTSSFLPKYDLKSASVDESKLTSSFVNSGMSYSFSENGSLPSANPLWGDKAGFFDSTPFLAEIPKHQFGWSTNIDGITVTPFVRTIAESEQSMGLSEVGFSMTSDISNAMKLTAGLSAGNSAYDFGFVRSNPVSTNTRNMELGITYSLDKSSSLFSRYAYSQYDNVTAGISSFGTNNLEADSINFGYEILSKDSAMTLGLKSDYQLRSGTLEMALPSAVDGNGDVYSYEKRSYGVSDQRTFDPYLSFVSYGKNTNWSLSSYLDADNNNQIGEIRFDIATHF